MGRRLAAAVLLVATLAAVGLASAHPARALQPTCSQPAGALCSPAHGVTAGGGVFHGLLAVRGVPWVLDYAAEAGSSPGCGDCTWTLVLACKDASPGDPTACVGAGASADCSPDQRLYRLFLSTATLVDHVVGTVCIGGPQQPVEVGPIARGDVERYLRDVRPPDLVITSSPPDGTLAGLLTLFSAKPPPGLAPIPFGSTDVTETITIRPAVLEWQWGDGSLTGWVTAAAGTSHAFLHGGVARIRLRTRWGARYTIGFQGETFGPYDATGQVTRNQSLALRVGTSEPVLVSR